MKKKIVIPFEGTKEQELQLKQELAELVKVPGGLMPALQKAQEIYGYLPKEVQIMIADAFGVPLSQFSLYPKGKYQVSVCLGTACYVKGSGEIFDELVNLLGIDNGEVTPDRKFSLDATRCVGCCGLAPVMCVNGEVYGRITAKDVKGIIEKYN